MRLTIFSVIFKHVGIFFAFLALLAWGFGDFLIQKSARKFGDWISLFFIVLIATVTLLPFVYRDLGAIFSSPKDFFLLIFISIILLFAAIFDFEALRKGKISVIAPVFALEVPIAATLAAILLKEGLTFWQIIFIIVLVASIFLISMKSFSHLKRVYVEKGVFVAVLATVGMGALNFLFGFGSREISPLMVNWFTSTFVAVVAFIYLIKKSQLKLIREDWRLHKKLILGVGIIDNLAWVTFSYSTLYIPIAISTGISESYIALSSILGLTINKEKLKSHQKAALVCCVVAAVILAFLTEK